MLGDKQNSGKKHAAVSGVGVVGRSDCRSCGDDKGQWKALVFKASSLPSHLILSCQLDDYVCLSHIHLSNPTALSQSFSPVFLLNVRTSFFEK